MKITDS